MSSMSLQEKIRLLRNYSACDVSDALLKLQKPAPGEVARAGYIADMIPFAPKSPMQGSIEEQPKIIAPASTLKLVEKTADVPPLSELDPGALPKGKHWVDMVDEGTVVVIEQPAGQTCAAIGGIMAQRMKVKGIEACLVGGRVRDLAELRKSGLPIWAYAKSTVSTSAESKVYARNIVVRLSGVEVSPGDIVLCDPLEGVVVIPRPLLEDVLQLMPKLVKADEQVKEDVASGANVYEAFQKHRS